MDDSDDGASSNGCWTARTPAADSSSSITGVKRRMMKSVEVEEGAGTLHYMRPLMMLSL